MAWTITVAAIAFAAYLWHRTKALENSRGNSRDRGRSDLNDRGQPSYEQPKAPQKGETTFERVRNPRDVRIGDTLTIDDDEISPVTGTVDRIEELTDDEDPEDIWWSFRLTVAGQDGLTYVWLNAEYDDDDRPVWMMSEQLDDITAQNVLGRKVTWENGPPHQLTHEGVNYKLEEGVEESYHYLVNAHDWHPDRSDVADWKVRCSDYKSSYDTYLCVEVWKDGRATRTCVSVSKDPHTIYNIKRVRKVA